MTLLEALAALIVLGSTAVGFLEVFHTTTRLTRNAEDWARVTAFAESVMESAKLDRTPDVIAPPVIDGNRATVTSRPWAPGIREVIVVVTSASGRRLELRRLTRDDSGMTGQGAGTGGLPQ